MVTDPRAVPALLSVVLDKVNATEQRGVRIEALKVLAESRDTRMIAPLLACLPHIQGIPELREPILQSLTSIGNAVIKP